MVLNRRLWSRVCSGFLLAVSLLLIFHGPKPVLAVVGGLGALVGLAVLLSPREDLPPKKLD